MGKKGIKFINLEYNNFIVTFEESYFDALGRISFSSIMVTINSKDGIEYLYGIRHGMTKKQLELIIGIAEAEYDANTLYYGNTEIDYNKDNAYFVYFFVQNNIIIDIEWYNFAR
jgi:hypothetical protein